MSKALVIVESPAKIKTLQKILGNNYVIKSSVGHFRDVAPFDKETFSLKTSKDYQLPQSVVRSMGINPYAGWAANFQLDKQKHKVVSELKAEVKKSDKVILATDLDREGESIAWHLKDVLKIADKQYERIIFNEITQSAILEALKKPRKIDENRVNAQKARRFLDRLVGFAISPIIWKKVARGLSAGRVQSVALRLIAEQEEKIRSFVPQEYWSIILGLGYKNEEIDFLLTHYKNEKIQIAAENQAKEHIAKLEPLEYQVVSIEKKEQKTNPLPPFITSSLQQSASSILGFSIKRTMQAAQRLYEKGQITYMRTDSTHISQDSLEAVRKFINKEYGTDYCPEKPKFYASKQSAQEAHEAIRPTRVEMSENACEAEDEKKLYRLIRNRFIASQMTPGVFEKTKVIVQAGDYKLMADGRRVVFPGCTRVWNPASEIRILPEMQEKDILNFIKATPKQHFTQGPNRYSEASLVQELEKRGIGRPSTYVPIIATLVEREYVRIENRKFHLTTTGEVITRWLLSNFQEIMQYEFTSQLESRLDSIATGSLDWKKTLDSFLKDFYPHLQKAEASDYISLSRPLPIEPPCGKCGGKLHYRVGVNGAFLGCENIHREEDPCKQTYHLDTFKNQQGKQSDEEAAKAFASIPRCPVCSKTTQTFVSSQLSRKFHVCSNYPMCDGLIEEQAQKQDIEQFNTGIGCHKCEKGQMFPTKGPFGPYFRCSNADCKASRKMLKDGKPAPVMPDPIPMPHLACEKAKDTYLLRFALNGMFLAASKYPKIRETRPITLLELVEVGDKLEEKFKYLLSGPSMDPNGFQAQVFFDKKEQTHFLGSVKEGKKTSWKAYFNNGAWFANQLEAKSSNTSASLAGSLKKPTRATSSKAKPKSKAVGKKRAQAKA